MKELGGTGYLIPEIALDIFTQMAELKDDSTCLYTTAEGLWEKWTYSKGDFEYGPYEYNKWAYEQLADQDLLQACVSKLLFCHATGFVSDEHNYREECFFTYYIYNDDYRQKVGSCLNYECPHPGPCLSASPRASFRDWFALPVPE